MLGAYPSEHFSMYLNFITTNSKKKWKKLSDRRIEMPDYPERSVLEGLVNALIHRSYIELGSEVHIDMFDDRLEIYSPGGMYDGTKVQERDIYNIPSKRRNPVIADIFNRLHFMERRGSGFKKICEDYAFAESYTEEKKPRFISDNDNFTLILPNLNYDVEKARATKGPQKDHKQGPEIIDRKAHILDLIALNPKISRSKISVQLGLTEKQVRIALEQLVAEGKVKREGADRGGQWIVL